VRMKALLEQHGLAAAFKELPAAIIAAYDNLVGDLAATDTAISDEDQALLLLISLPSFYDNFVETLLYGQDTLKLEDVLATLNSRELQKMTEAKGDGGEELYNHKKSQGFVRNEDQVFGSGADGYGSADVMMAMSVDELFHWIMDSGGSYHITYRRDYLVDFEEYDGGNILLGDGRECRIWVDMFYREDAVRNDQGSDQEDIEGTLKGRKQLGGYQTGWKIKTGNVLDSCNQRSTRQCTKSGVPKHLSVARIQQQNGLVEETNVTLSAKVRYFLIQSSLSMVFWAEDTTMSTYLVNRTPSSTIGFRTPIDMLGFFGWLACIKQGMLEPALYRNIGFNESEEYKKTFIGSGVGGTSREFQSRSWLARDREQHLARELFGYREDRNEAAFAVAEVEKIYAHESLTFNNTIACEVISKWKAGLKDDMDARSVAGNAIMTAMAITGSIHQSRFYNGKLVHTLLEGHSILSLEGSLSGDCDVEKNGNWSRIYAVESQEYQMVCTRLDISSADVGMLDKFDCGLQTNVQVFVDFDYVMGRSITAMGRSITSGVYDTYGGCKGCYLAKGTHYRVMSRTKVSGGFCYWCLVKGYPWSEVPA
ncbi:zinc finger, CCHC-type containing protein, partial [Tanacetum coccineum]